MFGLASAGSWGAGDFAGGLISRYGSVFAALIGTQSIGLAGTLVILGLSGEQLPGAVSLGWAAAAGASGVFGLSFFYYALSRGTMGVVAPLAALIGAGVPVVVAVVGGESVAPARSAGIVIALAAVVLISMTGAERSGAEPRPRRIDVRELSFVVLAGLGFAGFFLFADRATAGGETWWPLLIVRVVGLALVMGIVVAAAARVHGAPITRRLDAVLGISKLRAAPIGGLAIAAAFIVVGLGDLGGNAFFILAKHADALAVAVVLSSLYPVVTTILAAVLLHERLRAIQVLGVVLATISVPLLR